MVTVGERRHAAAVTSNNAHASPAVSAGAGYANNQVVVVVHILHGAASGVEDRGAGRRGGAPLMTQSGAPEEGGGARGLLRTFPFG